MADNSETIIIAAVLLVAVALLNSQGFFTIMGGSGAAILSADKMFVQSSNEQLGGKEAFVIVAAANRQAQRAVGTFTPDDVEAYAGKRTGEPFTLTLDLESQSCNYVVQETDEIIYSTSGWDGQHQCSTCSANAVGGFYSWIGGGSSASWGYYTIWKQPVYRIARVSTITLFDYVVNISVEKASGEKIGGVLTPNTPAIALGDKGSARWAGNYGGTQSCPQPAVDTIFYRPISGDQKSYKAASVNDYNFLMAKFASSIHSDRFRWDEYNRDLNAFLAKPPYSASDIQCSFGEYTEGTNYRCYPSQPTVFPNIQVVLLADWVGIGLPEGMPQIVSVGSAEVVEANLTRYPVQIKNVGKEGDTFTVWAECPTPIQNRAGSEFIRAGETKTVNLEVEGFVGTQACKVWAGSVSFPQNKVSVQSDLEIILRRCPAELACCSEGSGYQPKGCAEAEYCLNYESVGEITDGTLTCTNSENRPRSCQQFTCLFTTAEIAAQEAAKAAAQASGGQAIVIAPPAQPPSTSVPTVSVLPENLDYGLIGILAVIVAGGAYFLSQRK